MYTYLFVRLSDMSYVVEKVKALNRPSIKGMFIVLIVMKIGLLARFAVTVVVDGQKDEVPQRPFRSLYSMSMSWTCGLGWPVGSRSRCRLSLLTAATNFRR